MDVTRKILAIRIEDTEGSNILGSKMWHLGPTWVPEAPTAASRASIPFRPMGEGTVLELEVFWSKIHQFGTWDESKPPWCSMILYSTVFGRGEHPAIPAILMAESMFDIVWWVSIHSYMAQGRSGPIGRVIPWTWNLWTWLTAIGGPVVPAVIWIQLPEKQSTEPARPQLGPEKLPTNKSGFLGVHWGCRPAFHCTLPGHMSWFLGRVRYTWVSRRGRCFFVFGDGSGVQEIWYTDIQNGDFNGENWWYPLVN